MQHMVVKDIKGSRCFHLEIDHVELSAERALCYEQNGIMAGAEVLWYAFLGVIPDFGHLYLIVFPSCTLCDARRIAQNRQIVAFVLFSKHILVVVRFYFRTICGGT